MDDVANAKYKINYSSASIVVVVIGFASTVKHLRRVVVVMASVFVHNIDVYLAHSPIAISSVRMLPYESRCVCMWHARPAAYTRHW